MVACGDDPVPHKGIVTCSANLRNCKRTVYMRLIRLLLKMQTLSSSLACSDCQARDRAALHFHFNMALASVGITKTEEFKEQSTTQPQFFSLASWKQRAFNERLLDVIISTLAIEPALIKSIHNMIISEFTAHSPHDSVRTIVPVIRF